MTCLFVRLFCLLIYESFIQHHKQADIKQRHIVDGIPCLRKDDQRYQPHIQYNGNKSQGCEKRGFIVFPPELEEQQKSIHWIDQGAVKNKYSIALGHRGNQPGEEVVSKYPDYFPDAMRQDGTVDLIHDLVGKLV